MRFRPSPSPTRSAAPFRRTPASRPVTTPTASGMLTVAEDSGLEIDALDGEPGVRSARFLGHEATYPERFEEIFRRLDARPERPRTARFVCAVAVVEDGTILFETSGTVEGEIARAPRGNAGFGYDPIFYYPPYRSTLAEVTGKESSRSHTAATRSARSAEWLTTLRCRRGSVDSRTRRCSNLRGRDEERRTLCGVLRSSPRVWPRAATCRRPGSKGQEVAARWSYGS